MPEESVQLRAARYYLSLGWSVIPVAPKGKVPIIKGWDVYGKAFPTEIELVEWFGDGTANVGIVTGTLSNLMVVDIDTEEGYGLFEQAYPEGMKTATVFTTKGRHLYFTYPETPVRNKARIMPGVDVRAEGGFIVAPPSVSATGHVYRWEHPKEIMSRISAFSCTFLLTKIANRVPEKEDALQGVTRRYISFQNGSRDESLFSVANALAKGGMQDADSRIVLETLANSWGETSEDERIKKWLDDKIASAGKRSETREEMLSKEIRDWCVTSSGTWCVTDMDRDLEIVSKRNKNNRRVILHRLVKDGTIERIPGKDRVFRKVDAGAMRLDWEGADASAVYRVEWPFGIERYVNLYPKNIVIIAGASNAGKTAFLLNVAARNADRRVKYLSSEMGPEELQLRLSLFADHGKDTWQKVGFFDRSSNFAHAVDPEGLNIIDYLELSDNFFQVGGEIREIFDRLTTGIAVIAIQKKAGLDLGRGAEFTLEKSRLYISMDHGKLKIVKAKNWAKKGINPNGRSWEFKLVSGCRFLDQSSSALSEVEM